MKRTTLIIAAVFALAGPAFAERDNDKTPSHQDWVIQNAQKQAQAQLQAQGQYQNSSNVNSNSNKNTNTNVNTAAASSSSTATSSSNNSINIEGSATAPGFTVDACVITLSGGVVGGSAGLGIPLKNCVVSMEAADIARYDGNAMALAHLKKHNRRIAKTYGN